jgi:nucleotide-binding universal stress UspA family protein
MNATKILLAFDGSAQSLNAAELCWQLASKLPISLTAQHVVNTAGLWQYLNFQLPGLTGSGPYIAAQQAMGKELLAIGETLVEIYQAKAQAHGVTEKCLLDEGDAIFEILRRSKEYDMVVIGHHPYTPSSTLVAIGAGGSLPRYVTHSSMAESLARVLDKPLLVVQAECPPWERIKLILCGNECIETSFRAAAEFASLLSLPLDVSTYFQGEETVEDLPDLSDLVKEAKRLYPHLELRTTRAKLWPTFADTHEAEAYCPQGSLVIIPTRMIGEERLSLFGTAPDLFVRHSGVASLLLWPADARTAEYTVETPVAVLSK